MFRLRTRLRAVERATCTHLATTVLRVLSRGACTSARFHANDRGCCFGCAAPDDLLHYKSCDRFRDLALHRLPGLEALPTPWREMWQHRDTWLT
eukprot:1310007-Pyramimonas_sp.AAC.1